MRKRLPRRETTPPELIIAIGLVWGHLRTDQFEEALQLARGCLRLWPHEERLILMAAYASVELLEPLDEETLDVLNNAKCKEWTSMILRRAALDDDANRLVN